MQLCVSPPSLSDTASAAMQHVCKPSQAASQHEPTSWSAQLQASDAVEGDVADVLDSMLQAVCWLSLDSSEQQQQPLQLDATPGHKLTGGFHARHGLCQLVLLTPAPGNMMHCVPGRSRLIPACVHAGPMFATALAKLSAVAAAAGPGRQRARLPWPLYLISTRDSFSTALLQRTSQVLPCHAAHGMEAQSGLHDIRRMLHLLAIIPQPLTAGCCRSKWQGAPSARQSTSSRRGRPLPAASLR